MTGPVVIFVMRSGNPIIVMVRLNYAIMDSMLAKKRLTVLTIILLILKIMLQKLNYQVRY
ncbi:Uncharacterised protein [uncultured archaeon]|nr:Uncharacterised protein [uncultured archaeon]